MKFRDRGVLVTGGGSGIGQQVCYAAAAEGARVAVGDLDHERAEITAAEIRTRSGRGACVPRRCHRTGFGLGFRCGGGDLARPHSTCW